MNSNDAATAGAFGFIIIFYAVLIALATLIYWKVASKAGYPGWYSLGFLVPCLNLVLLILFAFTEWPIERELRELRSMTPQPGAYPRYPGSPPV